nr:sterol desaturase family protein [Planktothrix agardhii]
MRIVAADFCFYVAHRLLHTNFLLKIHLKHHEFRDSTSFVAGHKTLIEYIAILNDFLYISILMNFGKIKFMFLSKKLEQKFDNLKRPA